MKIKTCSPLKEQKLTRRLGRMLEGEGYNASNATLIGVSSDYSSIVWQILRHQLSHRGEVCDGFTVDVPYPDQKWTEDTSDSIRMAFKAGSLKPNLILLEAGVIRGSNYTNIVTLLKKWFPSRKIVTATLYENIGSVFKSDYVAEYYDATTHDLTFWWEVYNKHWEQSQ